MTNRDGTDNTVDHGNIGVTSTDPNPGRSQDASQAVEMRKHQIFFADEKQETTTFWKWTVLQRTNFLQVVSPQQAQG